jgi:hypothetical protein
MSYRLENEQVILTLTRDEYDRLLLFMALLTGYLRTSESDLNPILSFLNRLNLGNPDWTPYQIGPAPGSVRSTPLPK